VQGLLNDANRLDKAIDRLAHYLAAA